MFNAIKWSFLQTLRKCVMVELWYILFINFTLFFIFLEELILSYFISTFDLSPMPMLAWQHAHNDSEEGSSGDPQPHFHVVHSVCVATP